MQVLDERAVDLLARDADEAGDERRVRGRKVDLRVLLAAEGDDRLLVARARHDAQLVALVHDRVGRRTRDHAVVQNARADEVAAHERADLAQRMIVERMVRERHVKVDRRLGALLLRLLPEHLLVLDVDPEDLPHEEKRQNDADDRHGIGAGITHGDVALVPHGCERLLRRAQTGRARHGAEVHAEELRQSQRAVRSRPDPDRQKQAHAHRQAHQPVEPPAAVSQGREERRAHLQADEEDEEDQAEVAEERNDRGVDVNAQIARKKAEKKHAGDADRDAEEPEAPDPETRRNDERIREKRVREGARVGKKSLKPAHDRNFRKFESATNCNPSL